MKSLPASASSPAITLIEILVVIALIIVVVPALYISFSKYRANRALETSIESFADLISTAHVYAREAKDEKAWGVRNIDDSSYEIVSGQPQDYQSDRQTSLNLSVFFENDFFVWFIIGTGEKDKLNTIPTDEVIYLVNTNGRKKGVVVSDTGVVQVISE